jgi:hypothetical protein
LAEAFASSSCDEKSVVLSGAFELPSTLPFIALMTRVAFSSRL